MTDIIGRRVKLTRAGREWKGCCPFHNEKTPSFYVNEDKGFYHCFGCGAHGDAIRFLTELDGLSFMDAVKALAAEAGIELPPLERNDPEARTRAGLHEILAVAADWFRQQLATTAGAPARSYLSARRVPLPIVEQFGLGFAPEVRDALSRALQAKIEGLTTERLIEAGLIGEADSRRFDRFRGRVMFPIHDQRGRVVGFGGRILADGNPKYLNSPESAVFDKGKLLYNLHRAGPTARKSGSLLIVEGYMDVIALAGAGISEVVAPLGTALTEDQIQLCWKVCDTPIISFDGDEAGRKAATKASLRFLPLLQPGKSAKILTLPAGLDPDDFIKQRGATAFRSLSSQAVMLSQFIYEHIRLHSDLSTAEGRTSFIKVLRDISSTIANYEVQRGFFSEWRRRAFQALRTEQDWGDSRLAGRIGPDLRSVVADLMAPNRIIEAKILASFARRQDREEIEQFIDDMEGVDFHYPALQQAFFELRDTGTTETIRLAGVVELLPREVPWRQFRDIMKAILAGVRELGDQRRQWKEARALYENDPDEAYRRQRSLAEAVFRTRGRLLSLATQVANAQDEARAAA